jgi:hypothetical protein
MKDRDVIKAFVEYLRANGFPLLKIDCWPEDKNPTIPDIDAVAGQFAIEHTSIDTLPNQRRDSDWFMQVVGGLKSDIKTIPFLLRIIIEYGAVTKGQNWAAIREALKTWIISDAFNLLDGRHLIDNAPRIPFRMHVVKQSNRPAGLFFGRFEPDDDTFAIRLRNLFDRKVGKLDKYHKPGTTTVLLIESDDIALMNEFRMLEAIQQAYPEALPEGVDEIWYADTSIPTEIEFYNFTKEIKGKSKIKKEVISKPVGTCGDS